MHASLWFLILLRYKATLRNFKRNIKSFRKGIVYIFVVLWFGLILLPNIMVMNDDITVVRVEMIEIFLPIFILLNAILMILFSVGERYINFPKAEIDFLFPAPLPRWHLLLYRIVDSLKGIMFGGVIFAIIAFRYPLHPLFVFLGVVMFFLCIQLICILVVLLRQTVNLKPSNLKYVGVFIGVLVGLSIAFSHNLENLPGLPSIEQLQAWFDTLWVKILLAPILPFSNLILSQSIFPEGAAWFSVCLMLSTVLIFVIVKLDAHFMELSIIVNQKIYSQKKALARGGRSQYKISDNALNKKSFQIPRLAGSGSIFARQWLTAKRQLGVWFYLAPILSFVAGIGFGFIGPFAFGIMVYLLFLFTNWLRFDFRGDIDQIDWLKQLPINSFAMSIGQIAAPVIWTSIVELCAGLGMLITSSNRLELFILLPCVIPVSLLLFGLHNFVFLLIPTRLVSHNPGDMQHIGRNMMIFFVLTILFAISISIAMAIGFLAYYLTGENETIMLISITGSLSLISLIIIPVVAWSYDRFDVGQDLPT